MPDNWQPYVNATYQVRHYGTAAPGLNDPLLTPTCYVINPLFDSSGTPAGNPSGLPNIWKNDPYVDVFGYTHPWANQANPYIFTQLLQDPPPPPENISNVRVSQTLTLGVQLQSYDPHYEYIDRFGVRESIEHYTFSTPDLTGLAGAQLVLTLEWRTLGGGFGSPAIDIPLGTDGSGTTYVRLMPPLPLLPELTPYFAGPSGYHSANGISPFHLTLTAIMPDGSRKNPNTRLAVAFSIGASYLSEINTGTSDGGGAVGKDSKGGVSLTYWKTAGFYIGYTAGGSVKVDRAWFAPNPIEDTFVIDDATTCAEPRLTHDTITGTLSCVYRKGKNIYRRLSRDYGETWAQFPSGAEVRAGVAHAREVYNPHTLERLFFYNDGSGKDSSGNLNGTGFIRCDIYDRTDTVRASVVVSDHVNTTYTDGNDVATSDPADGAAKSDNTSFEAICIETPRRFIEIVFESAGKRLRLRSVDEGRTYSPVI